MIKIVKMCVCVCVYCCYLNNTHTLRETLKNYQRGLYGGRELDKFTEEHERF